MSAVPSPVDNTGTMQVDEFRRRGVEAAAGGSADAIYHMFQRALRELDLRGDALDYGSGKGSLAAHMLSTGRFTSVTAVDILEKPAGLAEGLQWISADLNHPLSSVTDQSMDVIVSSEVIEHLENPRATVRDWFRILRPGGTLLFSTPNNESWRAILALIVQGHFVLFGEGSYPAHITALVRKDMERIAVEAGFRKPVFRYSNSGGLPKIPGITWQKITMRMLKGLRFSDNIMAVVKKPG